MVAQPTAARSTILVVDDDKLNRVVLANQLEMEGHHVITAEHGRHALDMLRAHRFDIVLLDLVMPELDGFQTLERMKADDDLRDIPVIVISAVDEMGSVVRSIQMGAADHLSKPCDPFLLRARITASLAAKRLRDQDTEYRRQVSLLTKAAADLEGGQFNPADLATVAARADSLGHLARVFQRMAREVFAREQHLQQQSAFKSALIGKISHELRSPFVAAGLSVQVLRRYVERSMAAEALEQISVLDRQLGDGRRMIDAIVTAAALIGKQVAPEPEPTDLAALIEGASTPLQKLAKARGVRIQYHIAADLPPVHVDRQQLSEAIQHLVHNAIKFNRPDGVVSICCRLDDGEIVFSVEDNGPGIAPDKLPAIWDAFTQTADDVRRGVEGLGLGLAVVQHVVEVHHATAFARSTPGQGSVFGIRLPAAAMLPRPSAQE
jgi:signal transduction histidine kinase